MRDKKLEEDNKVLSRQIGQLQMTCEAQSQQITKQEREVSELVSTVINSGTSDANSSYRNKSTNRTVKNWRLNG